MVIPNDLLSLQARENTLKKVLETLSRFGEKIPLLDPEEDMKVRYCKLFYPLYFKDCFFLLLSTPPLFSFFRFKVVRTKKWLVGLRL